MCGALWPASVARSGEGYPPSEGVLDHGLCTAGRFLGSRGPATMSDMRGRLRGKVGEWTHERSGVNTAGGIGMVLSVRKCLCAGKLDWRQSVWNVFASELVVCRGVQDGLWQRRRWAMSMKSLVSSCLLAISEPSARPAGPHGAGSLGGSSRARQRRRPDAFFLA